MNFNFGTVATPKTIGEPIQPTAAVPQQSFNLSFGTAAVPSASAAFTLGTSTTAATPTLSFATPNTAGFSFGSTTPATTQNLFSGFSMTPASSTSTAGGLTLGATPATTTPMFSLPTATTTSAGLSFGGLGGAGTSTGLGGTSLGLGGTTTTPSTGFSLAAKLPTPSTTTPSLPGATTALANTTPAIQPNPGTLTFSQLEEVLNKWTMELEEQGKVFINQALQLNAWDRLVIANGEKILNLNSGIEKIKQQQQQLDHELDFILAQQRELEDCIVPLENELKDVPITDRERNHAYQMAENMDTQLKQMSEDLKEIIEHLNETNKTEDNNNPVAQIGRILNAHMNSLQWIDRNTAQITTLLDQISKMHDMHRRDNERSFHLTYE